MAKIINDSGDGMSANFLKSLNKMAEEGAKESKYVSPLIADKVWVTTGIPELDWTFRTFGIKKGFIEISGGSQAGKTTLGLQIVSNYQSKYKNAIFIMLLSEQRIDDGYVVRLGVDAKRTFKVKKKNLEDLFFELQILINKVTALWEANKLPGNPKIIILWDSIGATISKSELDTFMINVKNYEKAKTKVVKDEDDEEDDDKPEKLKHAKMASFAKNARDFAKVIHAQLYEKDIIFICLNHLTDNLNSPHGGKTSTGGSWREYFPYLRLEMQRDTMTLSKHRVGEEQWGQMTKVKIIKNDFGGYNPISLQLCLGYGFTLTPGDIDYAVKQKIIEKKGEKGYSFLNGKLAWNSQRSFYSLYRDQNPLLKVLHNKIIAARHKDVLEQLDENEE